MSVSKLPLPLARLEEKVMQVGICALTRIWEYIYRFNLDTFFFNSSIYSCGILMAGHPCLVVIAIVSKCSGKESKGE